MKLLVFSDIHGDKTALEKLMEIEADYYFAAGDLANWSRGLERAGPILQRRADKMYVLPGNHESERDVIGFCADYGFRDFHRKTMQAGGFSNGGLRVFKPNPLLAARGNNGKGPARHLAVFVAFPDPILGLPFPPAGRAPP